MKSFDRLVFQLVAVIAISGAFALSVSAAEPKNPKLAAMIKKAAQEAEIIYQGPDPTSGLPTQSMLREMSSNDVRQTSDLPVVLCLKALCIILPDLANRTLFREKFQI